MIALSVAALAAAVQVGRWSAQRAASTAAPAAQRRPAAATATRLPGGASPLDPRLEAQRPEGSAEAPPAPGPATGDPVERQTVIDQVAKVVAGRVAALRRADEVPPYLAELERQATDARRVTALEVEPGRAAILRFESERGPAATQQLLVDFELRMQQLSRQFQGGEEPTAPRPSDLSRLRDDIARAEPGRREELVRIYRERVGGLTPEERTAALSDLAASTGEGR